MNFLALDSSNAGHLVLRLSTPEGSFDTCKSTVKLESELIGEADNLLKNAGLKIQDIDTFVLGQGPGSFMGLRLGFAVFRTWAWIYDKNITAVSSLDLLAGSFEGKGYDIIVPCIDAKMKKVFANIQSGSRKILEDSDIKPEDLAQLIPKDKKTAVIGSGILKEYTDSDNIDFYPDLVINCDAFDRDFLISLKDISKKSKDYLKNIEPHYLRLSAAEIALNEKNSSKQ